MHREEVTFCRRVIKRVFHKSHVLFRESSHENQRLHPADRQRRSCEDVRDVVLPPWIVAPGIGGRRRENTFHGEQRAGRIAAAPARLVCRASLLPCEDVSACCTAAKPRRSHVCQRGSLGHAALAPGLRRPSKIPGAPSKPGGVLALAGQKDRVAAISHGNVQRLARLDSPHSFFETRSTAHPTMPRGN